MITIALIILAILVTGIAVTETQIRRAKRWRAVRDNIRAHFANHEPKEPTP